MEKDYEEVAEKLGVSISDKGESALLLILREYLEERTCSNCRAKLNLLPPENILFIKYRCPKCGLWRVEFIQTFNNNWEAGRK